MIVKIIGVHVGCKTSHQLGNLVNEVFLRLVCQHLMGDVILYRSRIIVGKWTGQFWTTISSWFVLLKFQTLEISNFYGWMKPKSYGMVSCSPLD